MMLTWLGLIFLVLATIPAGLFVLNLCFYRRTKKVGKSVADLPAMSVLIPARNEEKNLATTLDAALANRGVTFEVIVLDDHSTDRTAEIVRSYAAKDPRVRYAAASRLPVGWCGKPHACQLLADQARHPLLVFLDADVRLTPDALSRMANFMATSSERLALASGVPRQEVGSFSERLLLPLIHFVLLGYLPMFLMRSTRKPAFSAGCGQLFIARADAYRAVGGHSGIRATLHDGLKLPRRFREAGHGTDLFDATDLATCRMYHTDGETWRGLGKNATEGLGAPGTILPMTVLLLGGQVAPFVVGAWAFLTGNTIAWSLVVAMALAWLPRALAMCRFDQPALSAALHPLGVAALVAIQWHALIRAWLGQPAEWKGRSYTPAPNSAAGRST